MRKSDEITGKITLPLDGSAFFGDFSLSAIALADWLALAEMKGSGKLAGEVELSPRDSGQGASGKLHLSDLVLSDLGEEPLRLKGADIDFTLSDILADLRIASDIRVQDMELAELSLQETRATLKGSLEAIDFTLDTQGTFREPLTLSTDGRAELGAGEERLLLSKLAGQVLSQELRLVSPLALRRRGPDLIIAPTALRYGPAELSLSLESKGQEIDLKAEITKASLTQLAALGLDDLPEGELAAKLTLAGKRPEPRGHLELSLTDLKLLGEGEAPAARLEITGQLRQGRLVLKGDLTGLAESAAKLQADLPLVFDEVGLAPAIPGHEAISGSLTWRGDVAEIWPLVPLTGHALSGPGHLDLRLGGSLQNPDLQGNFRLAEGRYENFDLGTQFSDLIAEVALKGDRIELAKLEANDRRKGRLTADGALDLEAERNFPFAFQIGMRELAVLQRDDLLAITDGDLKITGDATKPELQGKLTTRRVEITIPEQLPAEVAVGARPGRRDHGVARCDGGYAAPCLRARPRAGVRMVREPAGHGDERGTEAQGQAGIGARPFHRGGQDLRT
jgi:translocation and assembly module TamB